MEWEKCHFCNISIEIDGAFQTQITCSGCGEVYYIQYINNNTQYSCSTTLRDMCCEIPPNFIYQPKNEFNLAPKRLVDEQKKLDQIARNIFKTHIITPPKKYSPVEIIFSDDEGITIRDRLLGIYYTIIYELPELIKKGVEYARRNV